jgi:hypothetical protein
MGCFGSAIVMLSGYAGKFMLRLGLLAVGLLPGACVKVQAQQVTGDLTEQGNIIVAGNSTPYLIRHLPVSSFPALPAAVQAQLNARGCLIPQTYEAHRPENVVQASLEGRGTSDWAVLCSSQGTVSLLVFFAASPVRPASQPYVLASAPETERLQAHGANGVMGFNWGIDPASPRRVAEAQAGLIPRPAALDHDALADSVIDKKTIYHFYAKSAWTLVALPD